MKYLILISLFLLSSEILSQSVLTFEQGTSIGVLVQTDLCANIFTGSGIIYGGGTLCSFVIGIENDPLAVNLPTIYDLKQNYPNPFNPVTTVKYQLPEKSQVSIMLYDVTGKQSEVYYGIQNTGFYSITIDGSDLSSGIYFLKLTAESYTKTIKISLIK